MAVGLPAGASGFSRNEAASATELATGPRFYRYGSGAALPVTPAVGDGFSSTALAGGVVRLETMFPALTPVNVAIAPWWDTAWRVRRCAVVAGTGTQFVDLPFDSTGWTTAGYVQSDYRDLRVVVYDGAANTLATSWTATPFDTDDGHVYASVAFGASSTRTVCLYAAHDTGAVTSVSDPMLGQVWGTFEAVYREVNPSNSATVIIANPTTSTVSVSTSSTGAGAVALAPAATTTLTVGLNNTLYATGAIAVRGNGSNGNDSLAPLFHTGTTFAANLARNVERWCLAGTAGTAVTINPNGTPTNTTVSATVPCTNVDAANNTTITAAAPISAFQVGVNLNDATALYPATSEPLYGVASNSVRIGTTAAGQFDTLTSAAATFTTAIPVAGFVDGANGTLGTSPAFRLKSVGNILIGAHQQADGNGSESTVFLPMAALSSRYVLPMAATYVAIACPRAGETILVGTTSHTCSGTTTIGKLLLGATTAGTVIRAPSGAAFYLYYHVGTEETNVFVPRLSWASVKVNTTAFESLYTPTGTWTSSSIATSGLVLGLFSTTHATPTGTTIAWEIACAATAAGPFTFTAITPTTAVPHACDGLGFLRARATLTTTDPTATPTVTSAAAEQNLVLATTAVLPTPLATGTTWLWRIHDTTDTATDGATLTTTATTATGTYTLQLVDGLMASSTQLSVAGGSVSPAGGPAVAVHVSSIRANVTALPTTPMTVTWRTNGAIHLERDLAVTA